MSLNKTLLRLRTLLTEGPSYSFYFVFSRLFSTYALRTKAASTPYRSVRHLLLIRSGIEIGTNVAINFGVFVVGIGKSPAPLTLEDNVAVGPYVVFLCASEPTKGSILYNHPQMHQRVVGKGRIIVEEDAWIGAGAVIQPNIRIGRGSVVGSASVVTSDVPAYSVVAGIPARVIRALDGPNALS